MTIALIVSAAPVEERRALIMEGLEYGRRHGHEQATATYLLSHLATLQFGTGEWDASLATMARMHEASSVFQWAHIQRGYIAAGREGPEHALPHYTAMLDRRGDPAFDVIHFGVLAYGHSVAGRFDDARAWLGKLDELIERYPSGGAEHDTPRSALGGPMHQVMFATALYLDDPRWIDVAAAEMRPTGFELAQRHNLEAARALLASDAGASAREITAAREIFERVGFEGMADQYAINCIRVASARGLDLGAEWRSLAKKLRAFSERAGARWWLSVLEDAGL
jgi:hypothetical protein